MKIESLKDNPHLIEDVIHSMWEEWGNEKNKITYERFVRSIYNAKKNDIPQIYVAVENDRLVGAVALLRIDLMCRQDLYPWLACLFVVKECRGRGISKLLINCATENAKEIGYNKIYLITEHENYYEKFGWAYIGNEPKLNGEKSKLYEKQLFPNS